MALKNPRIKYTVTVPGQKPFDRVGDVSGYVFDRDKLINLLKHPWGDDSQITNLRAVDRSGKDLAEQPDELKEDTVTVLRDNKTAIDTLKSNIAEDSTVLPPGE